MSRPMLSADLLQRPRNRDYLERKKQGLVRAAVPWDWCSSAQAAEAARQAFRTATWVAHRDNIPAAEFAALLSTHTGLFLEQLARQEGVMPPLESERPALQQGFMPALAPQCLEPAAELLRQVVAANWRPQYPVYQEASKDLP